MIYPLGSPLPTQAGRLGDEELELREFYVRRRGKEFDIYVGRKFSLELAAVKFDGLELQRKVSKRWTYIGFAGLYPTRGSRDLRDDYPKVSSDPSVDDAAPKRLLPFTGGLTVAVKQNRFEVSTHGTLRRRPQLDIPTASGDDTVSFPTAKAVDVFLGVVDRKSWKQAKLNSLTGQ